MPATKAKPKPAPAARKRAPANRAKPARAGAIGRTTDLSDDVLHSVESGQRAAIDAVRKFVDTVDRGAATRWRGAVQAAGCRRRGDGDGRPAGPHAVRLPPQGGAQRRSVADQVRREVEDGRGERPDASWPLPARTNPHGAPPGRAESEDDVPNSKLKETTLHGHKVSYRTAGERGPVVVLIHGIAGTSEIWDRVLPLLGEHHQVIAPDLLGHGDSASGGDYSLGAYASGMRDLLAALGHDRATVVGHSLGGGVAMQFAYQFPEMLERLALVSSGGLGRDLNLLLRSAALPGAEYVLPLMFAAGLPSTGTKIAGLIGRIGFRGGSDLEEIGRGFASLADTEARRAFIHTVRE